jgi:hypothetical protein
MINKALTLKRLAPMALAVGIMAAPAAGDALLITISTAGATVGVGAIGQLTLRPENGTTQNVSATPVGIQSVQLAGTTDFVPEVIPFTVSEVVTVDGVQQSISFTGQVSTDGPPNFTTSVSASGPGTTSFGGVTLDITGFGFTGAPSGSGVISASLVPEPSTFALLGAGIAGLAAFRARRQRA